MTHDTLHHNATTPLLPEVVDAMLPYLREQFGNPSSGHAYGSRARNAVAGAGEQVAELIWCDPDEVMFTSGGTEANNLAIRGVTEALDQKRHVITTVIEHHATAVPCTWLEQHGRRVTRIGVDGDGIAKVEEARGAIDSDSALVTVMHSNNERGCSSLSPSSPDWLMAQVLSFTRMRPNRSGRCRSAKASSTSAARQDHRPIPAPSLLSRPSQKQGGCSTARTNGSRCGKSLLLLANGAVPPRHARSCTSRTARCAARSTRSGYSRPDVEGWLLVRRRSGSAERPPRRRRPPPAVCTTATLLARLSSLSPRGGSTIRECSARGDVVPLPPGERVPQGLRHGLGEPPPGAHLVAAPVLPSVALHDLAGDGDLDGMLLVGRVLG